MVSMMAAVFYIIIFSWNVIGLEARPTPSPTPMGTMGEGVEPIEGGFGAASFIAEAVGAGGLVSFGVPQGLGQGQLFLPAAAAGPTAQAAGAPGAGAGSALTAGIPLISGIQGEDAVMGTIARSFLAANFIATQNNPVALTGLLSGLTGAIDVLFNSLHNLFNGGGTTMGYVNRWVIKTEQFPDVVCYFFLRTIAIIVPATPSSGPPKPAAGGAAPAAGAAG